MKVFVELRFSCILLSETKKKPQITKRKLRHVYLVTDFFYGTILPKTMNLIDYIKINVQEY